MSIIMLRKMTSCVLFCCVVLIVSGYTSAYTTTFKRPCRNMSPECVKKTVHLAIPFFANGSRELGLEPLDPCVVDQVVLTLPGLSIRFTEGRATGFKTCRIDFARVVEDTVELQAHCNLTIQGRYRSTGTLLMFPIDGDGLSTIKCENLKLHSILKLGTKIKNNDNYFEIKSAVIEHAYDGTVNYYMTNLFKNNQELSTAVLKFMNSHWRMIAEEFGKPLVEIGTKIFIKNVRQFLEVVPINELEKL